MCDVGNGTSWDHTGFKGCFNICSKTKECNCHVWFANLDLKKAFGRIEFWNFSLMQKRLQIHFLICACCTSKSTQSKNCIYAIGAGIQTGEIGFTPPRYASLASALQSKMEKNLNCNAEPSAAGASLWCAMSCKLFESCGSALHWNVLISSR